MVDKGEHPGKEFCEEKTKKFQKEGDISVLVIKTQISNQNALVFPIFSGIAECLLRGLVNYRVQFMVQTFPNVHRNSLSYKPRWLA